MKFFLISLGIRPRIGLILRVLFGVSTLSVLLCYADIVHAEKKPHPSEMQDVKQQKEITGKVTDVEGEPLVGVNVSVRGTTIGTITDIEGFFSLQVTKGAVLVISYIGYLKEILEVGDPATYSITLQEDTHKLDEVVVVGYQSKERKNLTGSVATVDTKMLENRPAARGTDLLQGVAPGLIISRTNPGRVGGGRCWNRDTGCFSQVRLRCVDCYRWSTSTTGFDRCYQ